MSLLKSISLFLGMCFLTAQHNNQPTPTVKEFTPAGRIEALLVENGQSDNLILVQLDLKNDSLFALVNDIMPDLELFSGPASYHRIMSNRHFNKIQLVLTEDYYSILNNNYELVNVTRGYWVDYKQGIETQGTWSEDDAIELTCSCLDGASDCVKLGWDDSWWNPLDYWGEAWYGFQPPFYQTVEEIRVTVRGAQCDDLPLWSETYMGMMDDNGNWTHDYELSIDYTDNEYIVGNTWSGGMLMPRIGSEDNYCIDTIKLEFFFSCEEPESPSYLLASDGEDCYTVILAWDLPTSSITAQTLYRDDTIIAQLGPDETEYEDWGAQSGIEHVYCIEVQNECGSAPMTCNPGSVKTAPGSPSYVNASNGEYANAVQINWGGVDADDYKIYRDSAWMGIVSGDQMEYTDVIAEIDVVYEYCIEAVNDCGDSNWQCDTGYTAVVPAGDVNADGSIDVLDIVLVVNIIVESYDPSDDEFLAADMNNDGVVDVLDIVTLVNAILGD